MIDVRRKSAVTLVCALVALGAASPAQGQVPTLQGEFFQGTDWVFEEDPFNTGPAQPPGCDPNGVSTLSYDEGGVATGPYPGTFQETVTVQIGPQAAGGVPGQPGVLVGQIVKFTANFKIISPAGTVEGTKELTATIFDRPSESTGTCFSAAAAAGGEFGYPQLFDFEFRERAVNVYFRYDATITSLTGTYKDSGEGLHRFSEGAFRGTCTIGPSCPFGSIHNGFYGQGGLQQFFFRSFGLGEVGPDTVSVTPKTAVNPVGTRHTVTATVETAGGQPAQGETVRFTVTGSVTREGACTTDRDGRCDFTYTGPQFPGTDAITACVDSDGDGQRDADESCDAATKEWVLPASTPGKTTGGGQIAHIVDPGVTFGFVFQGREAGAEPRGECNLVDHPTDEKIDCLNVIAYAQTGNEATVYGNASVGGGPSQLYRLHVIDNGESGIGKDVFEFETEDGYVRAGQLTQGDIQVHPTS